MCCGYNSVCIDKCSPTNNLNNIRIIFNVPRDTHRYLIESISQCLHVKTMLASRCVSFYETIEASSKLCIRFLSNLCKIDFKLTVYNQLSKKFWLSIIIRYQLLNLNIVNMHIKYFFKHVHSSKFLDQNVQQNIHINYYLPIFFQV